jgi:hypothetical protein
MTMTAAERYEMSALIFKRISDNLKAESEKRDAAIDAAKAAYDKAVLEIRPKYLAAWNELREAMEKVSEEESAQTDSSRS